MLSALEGLIEAPRTGDGPARRCTIFVVVCHANISSTVLVMMLKRRSRARMHADRGQDEVIAIEEIGAMDDIPKEIVMARWRIISSIYRRNVRLEA